ncbi:Uncharacterised protein [BD1-7 clade bacterium]|uniref:Thioesterase n=1 Tax=BD1-7 clade bacterium TaxID=2029982 RepID=A0A5S9P458_9GAMM|nr:Uncharacterised protein [BD1-7 clade bacterium]CAA0098346.1 Uncharacterised protein [BD1-7 clade bacterium]
MPKVQIELPDNFTFSTELDVLIQHINRANHLANEHLIALLNEARTRYCEALKTAGADIDFRQFINADLAVVYQSEAKYGERLCIQVHAQDFSRYGCDFVYRVTEIQSGRPVAIAKTAMLQFDYENQKLAPVDADFAANFQRL